MAHLVETDTIASWQDTESGDAAAGSIPSTGMDPEELTDVKNVVEQWNRLDAQIRKLRVALRERCVHQKKMGERILNFIQTHKLDGLNTSQGVIKTAVRRVKAPLKIQDVRAQVLALSTELTGEALVQRIFDGERPSVEKVSLRKVVPKVHMSLDV